MIIKVTDKSVQLGVNCTNNIYNVRLSNLGQRGLQGLKGDTGDPGADGLSAYQIAVNNGFVGTEEEWLASLEASVNSADYDLADFNNASADPFIRENQLPIQIIGFDHAEVTFVVSFWLYLQVNGTGGNISLDNTGASNLSSVFISSNCSILDIVKSTSILKKLSFVKNIGTPVLEQTFDVAILISDDVTGLNQDILYQGSFSTTNGILNVDVDLAIPVLAGKFITPLFKFTELEYGPVRNFKLEFYAE